MPARNGPSRPQDIVVFQLVSESACSECSQELGKGRFLRLEEGRPLCMTCSDLDHLVFLPSGNTALTRRASKHSSLRAVVVRFSRARKRYERQGILVEEEALERAEQECLADADARARARERAAVYRERADHQFISAFAARVDELFPGCPPGTGRKIAEHACVRSSGRVGRSASAKELEEEAIELAVRAHVRHAHTPYHGLLAKGLDRLDCRRAVAGEVEGILSRWRKGPEE